MHHDKPALKPVPPAEKRLQLGVLGKFFGDRDHAPVNIAGTVAILGFLLLLLSLVAPGAATGRLLEVGFTLTSTALAYVFGRSSR